MRIFTSKSILKKLRLLFAVFFLLSIVVAHATTYYISPTGYDGNSGLTATNAWKTLAHGLASVKPNNGDVLILSAGTFPVIAQVSIPAGVTITGAGSQSTVISCQYYYNALDPANLVACSPTKTNFIPHAEQAQFLINGNNITFSGVSFDGNAKQCNGGFFILGNNINYNNVNISNFKMFGIWVEKGDYVEIQNSIFKNNSYGTSQWSFADIVFWQVNHFFVHDNNINETGTGCYGIKEHSNKIQPCYFYTSLPETAGTNLDVNIYNNVINVDANGAFAGGSQPAITIEVQSGIQCQANIYNNWLNNSISLPIGSATKLVSFSYHVHHNYYDMTGRYGYAIEAGSSNIEFDHNIVLGGYYPLASWGSAPSSYPVPLENFLVHHNIFYAPAPYQYFQQQQGFNGYKFYNNTVIDTKGSHPIFSLASSSTYPNTNFEVINNIFMSTYASMGDVLWTNPSAAPSKINNNLFYNYTPKGTTYVTQHPGFSLSGSIPAPFFTLPSNSPAVDQGVAISGITDGFAGTAPDLGACEYGVTQWTAGVNAITPIPKDLTPPTVPANILLTNIKGTSATVSWTASTDNVGVDAYEIQLNGNAVGTTSSNSLDLSGLLPGTNYLIAIRARDKVFNWSALSTAVSFKTFTADRELLLQAENYTSMSGISNGNNGLIGSCDAGDWVSFKGVNMNQFRTYAAYLGTTSAADNVELRIDNLNGRLIGNLNILSTGSFSTFQVENTGLDTCSGTHDLYFIFRGGYGVGNFDWFKLIANADDNIAPTIPTGLKAYNKSSTSVSMTWNPSTDNTSVAYYEVQNNGTVIGTPTKDSLTVSNLNPNTNYSFAVRAYDNAGNVSSLSNVLNLSTNIMPDSIRLEAEAYTQMSGVTKSSTGIGSADNNDWISFSNVDLSTGYNTFVTRFAGPNSSNHIEIHIDTISGTKIGDITTIGTGGYSTYKTQQVVLSPNSGFHKLFIVFKGGFGIGNFDWFTLKNAIDTVAPTVPSSITATTINATSASIAWSASTDNYGVSGYNVYVNNVLVGSPTGTSFTIPNLTSQTNYQIRVSAVDRAGNTSAKSAVFKLLTNNSIILQAENYDSMLGVTKSSTGIGGVNGGAWIEFNQIDFGAGINQLAAFIATTNTGGTAELRLDALTNTASAILPIANTGSYSVFKTDSIIINSISGKHDVFLSFKGGFGIGNFDYIKFSNVTDTIPPTVPMGLVYTNQSYNVTLTWPVSTDKSGVSVYEVFQDGNSLGLTTASTIQIKNLLPNKTYNFTVRAGDIYNNFSAISSPVAVTLPDITPPTVVTKNITANLDSNGNATITPAQVNNASTDNVGISNYSLDKSSFDCSNIGTVTINLTATDTAGNHATATAIVTVKDTIAPTVITHNITVFLDTAGKASITPLQINNGSTDNCTVMTYSLDKTAFDCSNIGVNTVKLSATDASGNVATNAAIVTVEDTIAPIAITKNILVSLDATGKAIINPKQVDSGSSDNCAIATYTLDKTMFDCSNKGDNKVNLTVTDASGNKSSSFAMVVVKDTIPPVAITQNLSVQLDTVGKATITPIQVDKGSTDNCIISNYSLDKTTFDNSNYGANTVTLTVTDASGNSSSATATVTVEDNIPPTVLTKNITVYINGGQAVVTPDQVNNGSNDASGIKSMSLNKTTFDCSTQGANTVILSVTDNHNNTATGTAVVSVIGNIPAPVINVSRTNNTNTGLDSKTIALGYGAQSIILTASDTKSSEDINTYSWTPTIGLSNTSIANPLFTPTKAGSYTFTAIATSPYGCQTSAAVTINVIDVRCGEDRNKVSVCHSTNSGGNPYVQLCIDHEAVQEQLSNGGVLGTCTGTNSNNGKATNEKAGDLRVILKSYPNPFNARTNIAFVVPKFEPIVALEVYSSFGIKLTTLYRGSARANENKEYAFDGSSLMPGVYFARLTTSMGVQTFRMVIAH